MIVVILLTIATGAVLLWALYTEQVPPPRSRGPRWTGLPDASDIQRRDFPLAVAGYDPRAVDAHLRAVATAFSTLRAQVPAPVGPPPTAEAPSAEGSEHVAFAPPPPGPSEPSPPSVPPPPSGQPAADRPPVEHPPPHDQAPPAEEPGWER